MGLIFKHSDKKKLDKKHIVDPIGGGGGGRNIRHWIATVIKPLIIKGNS